MQFKIGFLSGTGASSPAAAAKRPVARRSAEPVKSLVQVNFPARGMTLSYYNDAFDLHKGDIVFVDGKLEGLRGRVVDVSRSFRIKLADYKRVIGRADTDVSGTFRPAGSHMVTFSADTLPATQVRTWFLPPEKEDEEYVSGSGDEADSFPLSDLGSLGASPEVIERGRRYYREDRVSFLCLDGTAGYAIVEGSRPYEVEFSYADGMVSGFTCPCWCSYPCKHQVAVLLQLKETLDLIEERYADQYARSGHFAAVSRDAFFTFAVGAREDASITLE